MKPLLKGDEDISSRTAFVCDDCENIRGMDEE